MCALSYQPMVKRSDVRERQTHNKYECEKDSYYDLVTYPFVCNYRCIYEVSLQKVTATTIGYNYIILYETLILKPFKNISTYTFIHSV